VINGRIGEALGKLYVEKSFRLRPKKAGDDDKKIFIAFENRINNLTWMFQRPK
jgi:endothelin-converting enzyme/putative endopeptidase